MFRVILLGLTLMKKQHILDIKPKLACIIAGEYMRKDKYHQNILVSARILLDEGMGNLSYGGQFLSGNTYWWENRKKCYTVDISTGKIRLPE